MKLTDLKRCIKNSWCVEKHWDAIIELIHAVDHLYYHKDVKLEGLNERGHTAVMKLRDALKNLEDIEWKNETSLG